MSLSRICSRCVPLALRATVGCGARTVPASSVGSKRSFLFHRSPIIADLVNEEFERQTRFMERQLDRALQGTFGNQSMGGFVPPTFRPSPYGLLSSSGHRDVPIETAEDGSRVFRARFDLPGFKPENVRVTVDGSLVTIKAKAETVDEDGGRFSRDYSYAYTLPSDINVEHIKSFIEEDGALVIEAPLPKLEQQKPKVHELKIERGGSNGSAKAIGDQAGQDDAQQEPQIK